MQRVGIFAIVLGCVGITLVLAAKAADDPPKPPVVSVKGTVVYLGKGRENITLTLKPEDAKAADAKAKPLTATSDDKGAFQFNDLPAGKYKLTAQGKTSDGIRRLRELDAVDVTLEKDATKPVTVTVKLTTD